MARSPMTLGELAATLKRKEQSLPVYFDFVFFQPAGIHSYRGYYEKIALGYDKKYINVAGVLELVSGAIGKKFTGYKGGEYLMGNDTPVYVANPSETGNTVVVDVQDFGWAIILVTEMLNN